MEPDSEFSVDVGSLPESVRNGTLPHCGHCSRKESSESDIKLKRCNGCHAAVYCSKECQKAAWPGHRDTCHSVRSLKREDAPESYAGYDTPVVLINAIKAWLQKQHDTFRFLARATVLMSCNVEQVFATPEPSRFLVIQIAPGTHPTAENWNPGNAFRFVGGSITEKTVARSVMPLSDERWNEWMTGCRRKGERYRQSAPSESSLPFLGTIPTIVIVNPFLITMLDSFHIHGLRYPHRVPTPLDQKSRPAFDDIVNMCTWSVDEGCVLRHPTGRDGSVFTPDVGVYVRKGKNWKWEPLKDFNWAAYTRYRFVNLSNGKITCMEPELTWGLYYNL
ncbi:hypothetical protein FKP32DRAFT_1427830 [Trametes sanguinea]|nr:hypothetical protein FKP32DRAFT_1427830 [Trametes sanguinea]